MIQAAIFDFDGTLIDSRSAIERIMKELSSKYNLTSLSADELIELRTKPLPERLRILGISKWNVPRISRAALKLFSREMRSFSLYPGVPEMLDAVRADGVHTHILSSNSRRNIRKCLRANGLSGFHSVHSGSGLFDKDRRLEKLRRKLKLDRTEMVYVGDELRDVEASRRAGIPVIAVTWGYDSVELLKQGTPDHIVDSADELADLIRGIASATAPQS